MTDTFVTADTTAEHKLLLSGCLLEKLGLFSVSEDVAPCGLKPKSFNFPSCKILDITKCSLSHRKQNIWLSGDPHATVFYQKHSQSLTNSNCDLRLRTWPLGFPSLSLPPSPRHPPTCVVIVHLTMWLFPPCFWAKKGFRLLSLFNGEEIPEILLLLTAAFLHLLCS